MKNLLLLLFKNFLRILVFFAQLNYGYSKCQKSCTNTFKNSIVSIIGHSGETETELLAPFHSIIIKSRSTAIATRKISWICFAVTNFEQCSQRCPASNAKSMRMASVLQWNTICNASKESPTAFTEFIMCERHHIDKTMKKCPLIKVEDKMSLKEFCKKLQEYTECYINVPFECSTTASDLWLKINNSIQQSFNFLLQLSSQHLKLPPECQESMATTLPMGIITTIAPPPPLNSQSSAASAGKMGDLVQSKSISQSPPAFLSSTTLSSLYQLSEDSSSSTSEDYSYFQQTDDYKYFGRDRDKQLQQQQKQQQTKIPSLKFSSATTLPKLDDDDDEEIFDGEEEKAENDGFDDYWIDLDDDPKKPKQNHQKIQNEKTKNKASSERRLVATKEIFFDGDEKEKERTSMRRTTTTASWKPIPPTSSSMISSVTTKISTITLSEANSFNSGIMKTSKLYYFIIWVIGFVILRFV